MNLFSEIYIKHLARTLFFISIGVSSSIGQNLLTKNILKDDFIATVVAVTWAGVLIMIYAYFRAEREHKFNEMEDSFLYHRILKNDNTIGAFKDPAEIVAAPKKQEITKIEMIHSMDKPMDSATEKKA